MYLALSTWLTINGVLLDTLSDGLLLFDERRLPHPQPFGQADTCIRCDDSMLDLIKISPAPRVGLKLTLELDHLPTARNSQSRQVHPFLEVLRVQRLPWIRPDADFACVAYSAVASIANTAYTFSRRVLWKQHLEYTYSRFHKSGYPKRPIEATTLC